MNDPGRTAEGGGDRAYNDLLTVVRGIIAGSAGRDEAMGGICQLLYDNLEGYDWVGFYLADPEEEGWLVLGPYLGEPTEHTRIPFGRGICGQAAEWRETFNVPDVRKQDDYLACSPKVRSEIVVPIVRDGKVLGEIDVDSHLADNFSVDDERFLERVAGVLSGII
ncbi:MAG: GAF domain-containing protein [Thermoplasmata archaeon]|nr:GAF domain-containing protein [Thermoplasmata archaeon]